MIKGVQVLIARNLLGLAQEDVAKGSGLSMSTMTRVEKKRTSGHGYSTTTEALEKFFKSKGIEFIEKDGKVGILIDESKLPEKKSRKRNVTKK